MNESEIDIAVKLRRDIINLINGKKKSICGNVLITLFIELCDSTDKKLFMKSLEMVWDELKAIK